MIDDNLDKLERAGSQTIGCLVLLIVLFISSAAFVGGLVRFLEMLS